MTGEGVAPRVTLRRVTLGALRVSALIVGLMALMTLVFEHGFYPPEEWLEAVRSLQRGFLYFFGVSVLVSFLLSGDKRAHLRAHAMDFAVVFLALLVLMFPNLIQSMGSRWLDSASPSELASAYLAVTQSLLLAALVPGTLRYSRRLMRLRISPSVLILVSFLALAFLGAAGLLLPRSTSGTPLRFLDALFMATSACSVTGLAVVDASTVFTPFGQTVLLVLIQAGGLGIMTLTTFFAEVMMGRADLRSSASVDALLADSSLGRIRITVKRIGLVTLAIEAAGAAVLYNALPAEMIPAGRRLFFAIFHAVSAFCNAGFALHPLNLAHPAVRNDPTILGTIAMLIILGGIGFPVLVSLAGWIRVRQAGLRIPMHLHTKIVLSTSFLLVALGTAGIFLLETGRIAVSVGWKADLLHAFFQSVSARTAGFNSLDLAALSFPSLFIIIFLMWIGGSPGSTAGGVKTTTLAVALLTLRSMARGADRVEVFRREIPSPAIAKAFSTTLLSILVIGASFFLMLVLEKEPFPDLLFETVSALGTVGLSTGITPRLTDAGKVLLIVLMLAGRAGLFGTVAAFVPRGKQRLHEFPKEDVLVV